jgi:hypothetical protein
MDGLSGVSFGRAQFGGVELGDRRRNRRLVQLAELVVQHPGGTLPEKASDPASLKALYRLMNCPAVTHAAVLAPARQRTRERMSAATGTVLLIHDTTELNYTGLRSLSELGQLGNGQSRGYLAHHVLAVEAESREVLGLAYQALAKRPRVEPGETRAERRARPNRESRLWKQASSELLVVAPQRQVEVADRGADLLEFLDFVAAREKHYLVRSQHNRRMRDESGGAAKLHTFARQLTPGGEKTVTVPPRPQHAGREATVSIAWSPVELQVPLQPRGETRGVPLASWVVCVREVDPPADAEPVEWILLTNVPTASLADAVERIAWYERRWMIEEYHKALKTGCGLETLQFTTEAALQPAIAFLSVIALWLLTLRYASRRADAAQRPATELFPTEMVVTLSLWRYKQPREDLTLHEFYYALARLGGHQNRKHDHPPGWLVLWRGWTKLQPMTETTLALGWKRCGQT